MKKILITGGAGYIGSLLATELVKLGHEVTVVDLLKYSTSALNHLYNSKNFEFIHGDVMNKNMMKKLISKNECIIPLAGLVGAPLCEKYKKDAINVNTILKTTAAPIPQKIIFFLFCASNWEATIPIITALSPAKTKSIKIIWASIIISSFITIILYMILSDLFLTI